MDMIKEQMEIYYEEDYEGDKSSGFETWYEQLITNQEG